MPRASSFSFSINDQLVSQVNDADYATGEVGLFVQTFDATNAHIHFDELTISNFEPSLVCEVKAHHAAREKRTRHGISIFQLFVQWRYDRAAWAQRGWVLAADRPGWKWQPELGLQFDKFYDLQCGG